MQVGTVAQLTSAVFSNFSNKKGSKREPRMYGACNDWVTVTSLEFAPLYPVENIMTGKRFFTTENYLNPAPFCPYPNENKCHN